jgi:hypothetical protein
MFVRFSLPVLVIVGAIKSLLIRTKFPSTRRGRRQHRKRNEKQRPVPSRHVR